MNWSQMRQLGGFPAYMMTRQPAQEVARMTSGYHPAEDQLAGDMPVKPACLPGEERPLVAEEVVAMYVADTLKAVTGVVKMHGSAWEEFSEKVHSGSGFPSGKGIVIRNQEPCLLYTSPSPRDRTRSRMPSSA